ncbi:uncharacterized protein [Prorops nasuta]|uniref:uncharacterized protein isoform X2 n=1 Tax=Prorops nasuta TaxID=863751 RepID=UPI0034CF64F8
MDCCNYVEPYAPPSAAHFYHYQHHQQHLQHQQQVQQHQPQQQPQHHQQYFHYENSNVYASYEAAAAPITADGNSRYNNNGLPSLAYPTDYVYNPKEARLRKAMREQNREVSRRSILQSAIATSNGARAPATTSGSANGSNFLETQHRFACVSGLPVGSPSLEDQRAPEAWFQTHRGKPVLRMSDYYVEDPIQRLQAMGALHQRSIDQSKDSIRNQECSMFNGYSSEYPTNRGRERTLSDYVEFSDSQKWHPYQNGASHHPRAPHPSQMGLIHPVQSSPHLHGSWSQYCHGMMPHTSPMSRNLPIPGPRHAVFLRDPMPNRHCAFPEEATKVSYVPGKLEVLDDTRSTYHSQVDHKIPRMMEPRMDCAIDSTATAMGNREEHEARWESTPVGSGGLSLEEIKESGQNRERDREQDREREEERDRERERARVREEREERETRNMEHFGLKKRTESKQPLPGFHQAFGSTGIGKFSRSEYFANIVGESESSESNSSVSRDRLVENLESLDGLDSRTGTASTSGSAAADAVAPVSSRNFTADENDPAYNESNGEIDEQRQITASYCPPTTPTWHSPHVGPIGGEISN